MTAAETIRELVDKVKQNGTDSFMARCPAHEDGSPSLSVRQVEGQALVHCFAGCATEDIMAALDLTKADLYDDPKGVTYQYDDGRKVHRSPHKRFRQTGQLKGTPTLYRRAAVVEAVKAGSTIYLSEGEKDCHALESIGAVATSAPMGASNFSKVDVSPLRGAAVVAVVDKDDAGTAWSEQVRSALGGMVRSLSFVEAKSGNDAADHIAAGGTLDEFVPKEPDEIGAVLLAEVEAFLSRFVAYPSVAALVAHVLWVVHTHLMDCWESTPRAAFLSPEPSSGKSRALEVTEPLVPRPVHAVNTTPAYLFRKVSDEAGPPTILYDEIDTVFGAKAKDNEDIRGMLNAGHRKGAKAGRCVVRGKVIETEELPAYCAVALAGLGDLPATIMTRAVVVRMRRRRKDERVEPWRQRLHSAEGDELRDRLATWAESVSPRVGHPWPEMPEGVEDRDADAWEPLLSVADLAGGDWPSRARVAAVALVAGSRRDSGSLGVRLLTDVHDVFHLRDAKGDPTEEMHLHLTTTDLLSLLTSEDEMPWGNLRGSPLDARGLSRLLGQYDVKPKQLKIDGKNVRGYIRSDFMDAWSRYLPDQKDEAGGKGESPRPSEKSATSATSATEARDDYVPPADEQEVAG